MKNCPVLNICTFANFNALYITSHHRSIPNAGFGCYGDRTNNDGVCCHKSSLRKFWRFPDGRDRHDRIWIWYPGTLEKLQPLELVAKPEYHDINLLSLGGCETSSQALSSFYVALSKLSKVVEQECKVKPTGAGKKHNIMFIRTS